MTTISVKTTYNRSSFIVTKTNLYPQQPKQPKDPLSTEKETRQLSEVGTPSYQRSLRRAFARAKLLAFFNPDLTQFITFTYKENILDENKALYDIKQFLKKEKRKYSQRESLVPIEIEQTNEKNAIAELSTFPHPQNNNKLTDVITRKKNQQNRSRKGCGNVENSDILSITHAELGSIFEKGKDTKSNPFKYIYVFERQKRGAIHVHMVCNGGFQMQKNNNGYLELKNWTHGFTSVLTIKDFDNNFKPYLYLFKYMQKAQRIGKSFIHTSKSFDKIINVDYDYYIEQLSEGKIIYEEDYQFTLNQKEYSISKDYFREKEPQNN